MNKKINFLLTAAFVLSFSSCDNDKDDPTPAEPTPGLYINEVCTSNNDWVELFNAFDNEIDIGGFVLQDEKGDAEQYIFPEETKIPAKSYLILNGEGVDFDFGLSTDGDKVVLLDSESAIVDEVTVPPTGRDRKSTRLNSSH